MRRNITLEKAATKGFIDTVNAALGRRQMGLMDFSRAMGWCPAKRKKLMDNPDLMTRGDIKRMCDVLQIKPDDIRPYVI